MAPDHMSRVYYGLSGSDANETQVKLVWYYNNLLGRPAKKKIISRHRGYHGSGLMTGSLTGLPAVPQAVRPAARPRPATQACPHYFRRQDAGESEEEFSAHAPRSWRR
jgi:L-2,4-diaminobutyrate transaminase